MVAPEASLSWAEQIKWVEQEAAARSSAPAAVPPVSLASSWEAFQPPADSVYHRPVLQDLDMITAVQAFALVR